MKKKPITSDTGISYTYDSDDNIKTLSSINDNNEPTSKTIEEVKADGIFSDNQRKQINDLFVTFGEIFKPQN